MCGVEKKVCLFYNVFTELEISQSVELNYNQQPVLLSELADSSYNAGNSGSLIQGNSLCSFISSYDNSRCTNLAIPKSDLKKR